MTRRAARAQRSFGLVGAALLTGALGCGGDDSPPSAPPPTSSTGGTGGAGGTGGSSTSMPSSTTTSMPPPPAAGELGIVHQSAPFEVVLASRWDGTTPFSTVRTWGNFGLGGFDHFRGEFVMQGEPYIVEADGIPRVPSDNELAVYAIVTPFVADITRQIGPATCTELVQSVLPALLPNAQGMYALTLTGNLSWALGRSFLGWDPPYPNASVLVAEGQVEFNQTNVNGAIIAYYMPQAVDGFCRLGAFCAQTGFHTHYISADRQQGGHLLDCTFDGGTLEITTLRELRLHAPDGSIESFFAPG